MSEPQLSLSLNTDGPSYPENPLMYALLLGTALEENRYAGLSPGRCKIEGTANWKGCRAGTTRSVRGRKKPAQGKWKKGLDLNLAQAEISWRTDCFLWEEGRHLAYRQRREFTHTCFSESLSENKNKTWANRNGHEWECYHGLTSATHLVL